MPHEYDMAYGVHVIKYRTRPMSTKIDGPVDHRADHSHAEILKKFQVVLVYARQECVSLSKNVSQRYTTLYHFSEIF